MNPIRRRCLWIRFALCVLAASLLSPCGTQAQADLNFLKPDAAGVPPRRALHAYLLGETQKHFNARRQVVASLQSPDAVRKRQTELKARFLEALGGFPEKTPLHPRVVGTLQGDGFRVEKVIYESRPQHHVTAALYLPEGKPPFPGVLMPCGHSANGKAAEAYQRACILLAKNGLAVLCYDPIGQGERVQLLTPEGKPAIAGSTSEHTMTGVGALLVGSSTATYRIWDGIRSLDYLASRPEIDSQRLGCTGNSGGGTLTAYLMALDDRIVAAAPSCYITSLERLFATIGPQDAEQNITGQVAFGLEHADFVTLRAPRPTLICVGTQDFFDINGSWAAFREAKMLYGVLGHGERVDLFEFNDKHGFSKPRREAALRWMRRWLLHKDDAPTEGNFPIFKDAELQCTRTGQVLEDLKGKSVFDLSIERARELEAARPAWERKQLLDHTRSILALPQIPRRLPEPIAVGSRTPREGGTVSQYLFRTQDHLPVPGLLFEPKDAGKNPLPLVLYVHGQGKATDAGPAGPIEKLTRAGNRVLAVDLPGMGETAPGTPPAKGPNWFGTDSREAFLALHLNRPLLGQRVDALLVVKQAALELLDQGRVSALHLVGSGSAGPIALHAAALDESITQVTVENTILSWAAVVRSKVSRDQLTNVVPGVLKGYDLPDLAGILAARGLTIRNPIDPMGNQVPQMELEAAYGKYREVYQKHKGTLVLQAFR